MVNIHYIYIYIIYIKLLPLVYSSISLSFLQQCFCCFSKLEACRPPSTVGNKLAIDGYLIQYNPTSNNPNYPLKYVLCSHWRSNQNGYTPSRTRPAAAPCTRDGKMKLQRKRRSALTESLKAGLQSVYGYETIENYLRKLGQRLFMMALRYFRIGQRNLWDRALTEFSYHGSVASLTIKL